jgi:hypothetical protein
MAFISNQWLDGSPLRSRRHLPVRVHLRVHYESDNWSKSKDVVASIEAVRSGGDSQWLYLTSRNVRSLAVELAKLAGLQTRRRPSRAVRPSGGQRQGPRGLHN